MWIVQICFASFCWYIGIHLLFREAAVWTTVEGIPWFRRAFGSSSTRKWERFCRDAGLICLATGCLLFLKLPFGLGVFGVIVAAPLLVVFL
ncbi:MAG: hypothetical protein OXG78_07550 [Chloroflexi bacterium]|nr:hypothetical protein [Chloroflexota bacterium]